MEQARSRHGGDPRVEPLVGGMHDLEGPFGLRRCAGALCFLGLEDGRTVVGEARCLESTCNGIELSDRSLFDYLHSEPRAVQTLKVDARGHPVGRGSLPFALLHTKVDGQGWWVAIEGEPNASGPCQYVNLFPDVPVRSK